MSNSNYGNNPGQENYRSRSNNDRSNFINRSGGKRDGGGFRIRLSDNEMRAVKSIQDTFQLKSTVAVLGFSVRTLSEMIEDKELMETIAKFAKNNKNSSSPYKSITGHLWIFRVSKDWFNFDPEERKKNIDKTPASIKHRFKQ